MRAGLAFANVSKFYGSVLGVSEVSIELEEGVVGLLGVNGAGKSTILKLAAGILAPSLGEVRVCGAAPRSNLAARSRVGFCPEVDHFYEDMSGVGWVGFMARLYGMSRREARSRAAEQMANVGMADAAMADAMNKKIGSYSKGMRQRTKLARALVHGPEILLLDEPLTGLDPIARHEIVELVRALGDSGKTVLVSSHVLEEVEQMTSRMIVVHQGRILAEGSIEEIRDDLEDCPHKVLIRARNASVLAANLLASGHVSGVQLEDGALVAEVSEPNAFFEEITRVGSDASLGVEAVVPLDASLDAVFDYLLRK